MSKELNESLCLLRKWSCQSAVYIDMRSPSCCPGYSCPGYPAVVALPSLRCPLFIRPGYASTAECDILVLRNRTNRPIWANTFSTAYALAIFSVPPLADVVDLLDIVALAHRLSTKPVRFKNDLLSIFDGVDFSYRVERLFRTRNCGLSAPSRPEEDRSSPFPADWQLDSSPLAG